jgi:hypothetical protein
MSGSPGQHDRTPLVDTEGRRTATRCAGEEEA